MLNQYNKGVTLIELMLAMVIGIIIIGGVMSLFVSSRDTQRVSQDHVQLASDSRFVMETIGYDLKHAGVFGQNNTPSTLVCGPYNVCPTALPLAVSDCVNNWYLDLDHPMVASDDSAVIDGADYSSSCASKGYKAGTDMLGVHYADPAKLTDDILAAGVAYARTNTTGGGLFVGNNIASFNYDDITKFWPAEYSWHPVTNPDGPTSNHKLVGHLYYVSDYTDVVGDGIPALRRSELGQGPAMTDAVLLSGVEDMQLQFGITTAKNPAQAPFADTYVNASNIPLIPGKATKQWSRVRSVKIWLLMRTERVDRAGISASQTFTIAGKLPKTYNTGHYRQLITGIVNMRNTVRINEQAASGG